MRLRLPADSDTLASKVTSDMTERQTLLSGGRARVITLRVARESKAVTCEIDQHAS